MTDQKPTTFRAPSRRNLLVVGAALVASSALLSSKMIKGATLKVYKGAPHGLTTTLKDQVNADLLAFIKQGA